MLQARSKRNIVFGERRFSRAARPSAAAEARAGRRLTAAVILLRSAAAEAAAHLHVAAAAVHLAAARTTFVSASTGTRSGVAAEELHGLRLDFGRVLGLVVLVLPLARLETALEVDLAALAQ